MVLPQIQQMSLIILSTNKEDNLINNFKKKWLYYMCGKRLTLAQLYCIVTL